MAVTRKRTIPSIGGAGTSRENYTIRNKTSKVVSSQVTGPLEKTLPPPHLQGTQVTVSESHPSWRSVNRPPGDLGGSFDTRKTSAILPVGKCSIDTGYQPYGLGNDEIRFVYNGSISFDEFYSSALSAFPAAAVSSDTALNAAGATAIARCAPAAPTANLLTSLVEAYHDGLPHLLGKSTWEERTRQAQDIGRSANLAGNEFLNAEFGVLPLVSDVHDFVKTVIRMDKLLQQYIRDNGQVVRRRYSFPPSSTVVDTTMRTDALPRFGVNAGANVLDYNKRPRGSIVRSRETTVSRWFSGAFVYHLPWSFFQDLYTPFASDFQAARRLFGLELTPDVLWELTPWSWAVDWFSNAGDVIHNIGAWANGGLVMKYGYIMEHSLVRDTYTYVGPTNIIGGSYARPHPMILTSEAKVRRVANPFGFGLSMGSLTGVQKSILAALGLTRLL